MCHLTPANVRIGKRYMTLHINWSKTNQTRDKLHIITLPQLSGSVLCPIMALQRAISAYNPLPSDPLFQVKTPTGKWVFPNFFSYFTPSGIQEPPWLIMLTSACRVLSHMAPGCQTVSGLISRQIRILQSKLHLHLLG